MQVKDDSCSEPRVDLLEIIMRAINEARPEWEVGWSASRKGRSDKRLSCCLLDLYPGVRDCSDIPQADLPLIKDHIEKQGYKVASIFASFGGLQVTFLLPSDADRFMALGLFAVPAKVSRHLARVEPLKEIPLERPFKLVVSGMRDWEQMKGQIEKWARKIAPGSWIGSRSTDLNTDLFIFSMSTWADTLKVLRAEESFRKIFPDSISAPRQLWDYNKNPTRRTLGDQGTRGADQITSTIRSMAAEIRKLRNEVRSVQLKQDDMSSAQLKLMDQVLSLDQRICITQQALLVQGHEEKIWSRVVELESQIGSLWVSLLFPASQQRRDEIQSALDLLITELDSKRAELSTTSEQFASVIGNGPPGNLLPAPQLGDAPAVEQQPLKRMPKNSPSVPATRLCKKRRTMEDLPAVKTVPESPVLHPTADLVCSACVLSIPYDSVNAGAHSLRLRPMKQALNHLEPQPQGSNSALAGLCGGVV